MSEHEQQFQAAIEGKTELRDVHVRHVENGFVVTGSRRWVEPSTGGAVVHLQFESVADNATAASARVTNFLTHGTFNAE